ncbi:hypothetical protein PUR61_16060, partial [Streptomyces sp. BE20]|uniref:hypothetical protein n=1 Tax=Streptomyces sp. BE20 TaxID=3002525 RepID=UPI002E7DFCE7|nr:hypothetical protein [Streptomyces sp. BE20]
ATGAIWERLVKGQAAAGPNRGCSLAAMPGGDLPQWAHPGQLPGVPRHPHHRGPHPDNAHIKPTPVAQHPHPPDTAQQLTA